MQAYVRLLPVLPAAQSALFWVFSASSLLRGPTEHVELKKSPVFLGINRLEVRICLFISRTNFCFILGSQGPRDMGHGGPNFSKSHD